VPTFRAKGQNVGRLPRFRACSRIAQSRRGAPKGHQQKYASQYQRSIDLDQDRYHGFSVICFGCRRQARAPATSCSPT
jgi:hypothetical protein